MGHLGTTASGHLLGGCDTLLIVGSNDPWTEFYPPPGSARAVQIDIEGRVIGNRYPVEVGLVGDAAGTLAELLERLPQRPAGPWRAEVQEQLARWHAIRDRRALTPARPIDPERAVAALSSQLPADAQVAVDVGSVVYWYARQLHLPAGVPAHVSGTLASMGCSVPYGLAAKLAEPGRPVVVLSGDGAMQMTGIAALVTVAHRWRSWADPRFVVCVLNNGDLAEVSWEQRETEGDPRWPISQALPNFPFAGYTELLGLTGLRVEEPEELNGAWKQALSADRPVVLDVVSDPALPPLPPFPAGEAKLEQMRAGLAQEGDSGQHARELLDVYAAHEGETSP